jgi:hypothetical protein
MQMIGQDDDGFDVEWMAPPNIAERLAQEIDVIDEKTQTAVSQIGREEKAAAADKEELGRRNLLKSEWEARLTQDFLARAYEDGEAIWRQFLASSGLSIIDTITSGEETVQVMKPA